MRLALPRFVIVAVLLGLCLGLVPPTALPFGGAVPGVAAAPSEIAWRWKITGRSADSRTVGDHTYVSTRAIDIVGSATIRQDAAGNVVAAPFALSVTETAEGTDTTTCGNGAPNVLVARRTIVDPLRYQGVPDRFLDFPEFTEVLTDLDGSTSVANPFITAFYSSGEVSRDFTYRYTSEDPGCGTARNNTSESEGVRYRITDLRTVGRLTSSGGSIYSWQGSYTITAADIFDHLIPMEVTVVVEARPQGQSSPSPSPTPAPSPAPPPAGCVPVGTRTLTVTPIGAGQVRPGSGEHQTCAVITLVAMPDAGQLFIGWTVDGQPAGHANPLTLTLASDRTVSATFVASPRYDDVTGATPYAGAIAQLAARGIIRGYGDGRFGPADGTLRAQMAALICRAVGWEAEDRGNPFTDRGATDADLWRNVGTLASYGVARGYGDGTYDPTGPVLHAQAVSFVTRAMVARGYWTWQPDDPRLYPNVPASSGHRVDLATYVHYAGTLPGTADAGGAWGWYQQPATRSWFAEILWRALDGHFGRDPIP